MSSRAGYTLLELLVTLLLGALLSTALVSTMVAHLRAARIISGRVASADAARLTLSVLPAELRLAIPAVDLHAVAQDSVAARLPRLAGWVCGGNPGALRIRASGMREPDSRKDSVLLVTAAGEMAAALVSVAQDAGACPGAGGDTGYRLETSPPVPPDGMAVIFESGTYYLRDRAFRYRLGAEGRQPLTEEVLRDAESGFVLQVDSAGASFTIRLGFAANPGPPPLPRLAAAFSLLNAGNRR